MTTFTNVGAERLLADGTVNIPAKTRTETAFTNVGGSRIGTPPTSALSPPPTPRASVAGAADE